MKYTKIVFSVIISIITVPLTAMETVSSSDLSLSNNIREGFGYPDSPKGFDKSRLFALAENGSTVYTNKEGIIEKWDTETGKKIVTFASRIKKTAASFCISEDKKSAASSFSDSGDIEVCNLVKNTSKVLGLYKARKGNPIIVALNNDGSQLAASLDNVLRIINTENPDLRYNLDKNVPNYPITDLKFKENLVAARYRMKIGVKDATSIIVWDIEKKQALRKVEIEEKGERVNFKSDFYAVPNHFDFNNKTIVAQINPLNTISIWESENQKETKKSIKTDEYIIAPTLGTWNGKKIIMYFSTRLAKENNHVSIYDAASLKEIGFASFECAAWENLSEEERLKDQLNARFSLTLNEETSIITLFSDSGLAVRLQLKKDEKTGKKIQEQQKNESGWSCSVQ